MNKKIILPFVAILVLAVAMVGAASADEVITVDEVEVRGDIINVSESTPDVWVDGVEWDAAKFAAFWYDLDDDLSTENLTLEPGTIREGDDTIDEGNLSYRTEPVWQRYELNADHPDLVVEGDDPELSAGYYIEGWMAEKYVAVNGNADKLVELLVEFEGDDKKTLSTGETWDLGSGYSLTAQQIDLDGNKVWLVLDKDGKELDSEVVIGGESTNASVYTYTEDLSNEEDVPVFSCLVDAVFRGTDSNIVQVMYVFLVDNDVLEIDTSETYGAMEVMTANGNEIILKNEDNTLDLSKDTTEHIMGKMYFKTADDADHIRFYPFVEYTEPGTYEVRGNIINVSDTTTLDVEAEGVEWDATKFAAFWYDLDDDLSTENLTLDPGTIGIDDDSIDEGNLTYRTRPVWQRYELNADHPDLVVEGDDPELSAGYYIEGWMAEKYVAVNGNADKLVELLVEFEGDDKKTLSTGETWDLGSGYSLTAQQIDLDGNKVWLVLDKDGKELDSEVVIGGESTNASVYTYTEDLSNEEDVPVFSCLVDAVFRGTDSNIVQVMYVFLVDNDVLEIDTSETYGAMEVMTANGNEIILKNEDNTLDLSKDTTEHIMGKMYFKTADDADHIRFYPLVEYTIGEAPGEADEEVETPTEVETVEANVTPTAVVTPAPEEAASPVVTATAEDTTAPEETETDKKTPGFEAVFAIAGLLAVAYLVLRQRE